MLSCYVLIIGVRSSSKSRYHHIRFCQKIPYIYFSIIIKFRKHDKFDASINGGFTE
jgi:coproporphyrinogen III oxidase-like Fe-S oxidoreductase